MCLSALSLSTLAADEPYGLCENGPIPKAGQEATPLDPNTPAQFTADRAKRNESGIATLEGAVQMTRGTQTWMQNRYATTKTTKKFMPVAMCAPKTIN